MSLGRYVLGGPDGKTPVLEHNLTRWAHWLEGGDRCVAMTGNKERYVSTVFLGLDHNFGGSRSKPILFETMVFGGASDGECERYCTWDEAEAGHKRYVELVFGKTSAEV